MEKPEKLDSNLWLENYGDMMYRYTLVRVRDPDAAEEIVQVALLAALQAQDSFQGRSSEKTVREIEIAENCGDDVVAGGSRTGRMRIMGRFHVE